MSVASFPLDHSKLIVFHGGVFHSGKEVSKTRSGLAHRSSGGCLPDSDTWMGLGNGHRRSNLLLLGISVNQHRFAADASFEGNR